MQNAKLYMNWDKDGEEKEAILSITDQYSHRDLDLLPSFRDLKYGRLYTLQLELKTTPVVLKHLSIRLTPEVSRTDRMMVNGFQAWTQSRELSNSDQISSLRWLVNHLLSPYGDYTFWKTPGERGYFASWSYTYFQRLQRPLLFFGSIDESFAYTVLEYDFTQNQLVIKKEIDSLTIAGEKVILQMYVGEGQELELWDEYSSLITHKRDNLPRCTGWTSWYNYYTKITEEIIMDNLDALSRAEIPLDIFQIDDGYQNALGDWLKVNSKFPSGMKALARKIKAAGFRPGLWLAPFICDQESEIFQKHPDWVLKNKKGKPLRAGWNPGWNGWFYSLDFYAPGFQEYLREVFRTILDEWGYMLVKLDFLYAVALEARPDKSRGQIMSEALDFLGEVIGDRWILGCGVPLGPAFGQVDFCRIGSDVAPYWEDNKLVMVHYRERVSTYNSLLSTLGRWQLSKRVFLNDPDVFILRDQDNKLTQAERYTLFLLNNLLGDLVFFSDHIGEYTSEQLSLLKSMYPLVSPVIQQIEVTAGIYHISFQIADREYHVYANLHNQPFLLDLPHPVFLAGAGYLPANDQLEIEPHGSVCLHHFQSSPKEPYLIGSLGHIFPSSQISSFEVDRESVEVVLDERSSDETIVYIGTPLGFTNLKVNGRYYSVKLNNQGLRYVSLSKKDLG